MDEAATARAAMAESHRAALADERSKATALAAELEALSSTLVRCSRCACRSIAAWASVDGGVACDVLLRRLQKRRSVVRSTALLALHRSVNQHASQYRQTITYCQAEIAECQADVSGLVAACCAGVEKVRRRTVLQSGSAAQ